jgi:hypothetical protein
MINCRVCSIGSANRDALSESIRYSSQTEESTTFTIDLAPFRWPDLILLKAAKLRSFADRQVDGSSGVGVDEHRIETRPDKRALTNYPTMRLFLLLSVVIAGFRLSAAEPVLKFNLTKADGRPAIYEFLVPSDDTGQSVVLPREEEVQRQHNAGVAALSWAKQFYGAHEIYMRSVELQEGPAPYYLAKFDGELAGSRQVFFAIVLPSGSVLQPVETTQAVSK